MDSVLPISAAIPVTENHFEAKLDTNFATLSDIIYCVI